MSERVEAIPKALSFRNVDTRGMHGEFLSLVECLIGLGLAVDIDGQWYDMETGKRLRENHVKCMVRKDYQRHGGGLSGSVLTRHIDALIRGSVRATNDLCNEGKTRPCLMLDQQEGYL